MTYLLLHYFANEKWTIILFLPFAFGNEESNLKILFKKESNDCKFTSYIYLNCGYHDYLSIVCRSRAKMNQHGDFLQNANLQICYVKN